VTAPSTTLKKCIIFAAILASTAFQPARYTVLPPNTPQTVISDHGWAYTVPFQVENTSTIARLIQCESQGVNIARPDSNHKISWGVLQFNGTSTWQEAERRFGYHGSPMIPGEAIHMADMMISAGMGHRWTCWQILKL